MAQRARSAIGRAVPRWLRDSAAVSAVLTLSGSMSAAEVVGVVGALTAGGIPVWLAGGWAVDALAGHATRRHGDLDLLVGRKHLERAAAVLAERGYRQVRTSRVEPALLCERVVFEDARSRVIDLHPVDLEQWLATTVTERIGSADPAAAFTQGSLDDAPLPCLSQALQVSAHEGYERRDVDARDVALLREHKRA